MAYDTKLAQRIRTYLSKYPELEIEEKEMFKGLVFMVQGKMCVNVSGDQLMCRFDPSLIDEIAERNGYSPMIMKNKVMKGYCYVDEPGFKSPKDFDYWMQLCLTFNSKAKASKKKK